MNRWLGKIEILLSTRVFKRMANKQLPYEVLRDYLERSRVIGPGTDWNITGMGKHDKGSYRIPDKD